MPKRTLAPVASPAHPAAAPAPVVVSFELDALEARMWEETGARMTLSPDDPRPATPQAVAAMLFRAWLHDRMDAKLRADWKKKNAP